jgi:hypothetical protein
MKRIIVLIIAFVLVFTVLTGCNSKKDEKKVADASDMTEVENVVSEDMSPVFAKELKNGTYDITVDSSSSMFRIESCELTVEDGFMNATMTMGGTGYLYVFMGTGEEAAAA